MNVLPREGEAHLLWVFFQSQTGPAVGNDDLLYRVWNIGRNNYGVSVVDNTNIQMGDT